MQNLVSRIFENAAKQNLDSKVAIENHEAQITYQQLHNLVSAASSFLKSKNINSQDRIIVALGNSIEHIIMHYAVIACDAISVPIPHDITEDRMQFFVDDLGAKHAFVKAEYKDIDESIITKIDNFEDLEKNLPAYDSFDLTEIETLPENLVTIMYTTGTTGKPKGVRLNNKCVTQALKNIMAYVEYDGKSKEVIPLPIYHNFGLGHVYCSHLSGGTIFIQDGLKSPKKFFKALDSANDGMCITPSMLKVLLGRYKEKAVPLLNKLKYIVVNSEPIPVEITKALRENCPDLKIMFYYGLTEASRSTFITLSDETEEYFKSVGPATSPDVKLKIIDGEICISGNHIFDGYWKNSVDSNIVDGWFKTGDLGHIDERGYLFITGRKKDMLNIGGLKISSLEIANMIRKIDAVEDVSVVAIEDETLGEAAGALIVRKTEVTEDHIIDFLRKNLENFAIPKKIVFANSIPKSETGKVLVGEVKEVFK